MTSLSYFAAVVGSLLLHALVIVLMSIGNWQEHDAREIRPQLQVVKAQLIELEAKAPQKTQPKTEIIDLTAKREQERKAEEARKLAQRKRNEEEKRKREEQKRKEEAKKREQEKKEQQEKERLAELERKKREQEKALEQQRASDFEQALLAEETYQAELQEQQVVGSIMSEIGDTVEVNWNRPPSARRGMQAILRVSLVPTGGLSAVEILESSGDSAFDRSATQAVQKAAPFEVVKELSPVVFEKNFRTFQFLFSPQDLRL